MQVLVDYYKDWLAFTDGESLEISEERKGMDLMTENDYGISQGSPDKWINTHTHTL